MDLKGIVDKAKSALQSNPDLIEKGGDAIDKATGNKFESQIDKAQDAARKAVGAEDKKTEEKKPDGE
ncbi:antitoxin [Gordonia sp. MP11Mi]